MLYYCNYGLVTRFLTVLFKKWKSQDGFKTCRPYPDNHAQHEFITHAAQADEVHVQEVMLMLIYGNGCQDSRCTNDSQLALGFGIFYLLEDLAWYEQRLTHF